MLLNASFDPMKGTGNMLNLIAAKQKVLGENLANIDTPGYTRKDVNFGEYLSNNGNSLETKLSAKFGSSNSELIRSNDTGEAVNPANELMEMQKNSLLYTMATRRMSSIITEMRTVINVGK